MLGRDVTHGCNVAATGELALDGTVLSVGGLQQKTIGARKADVDVFVVPAGENAEEAREHAERPGDHPCGEFSTGVAGADNCGHEVLILQGFSPL